MTIERKSFGSGDINLAAAILTMGVPPDSREPIKLVSRDNGKDYTRFHFGEVSVCGGYTPDELSAAWAAPISFKGEHPTHPFSVLMDFIATRPRGCASEDDWMNHASKFLGLPMDAILKTYRGIKLVCKSSPESNVSYVVAFIRNRSDLVTAAKRMIDKGQFHNMMDRGKSISIIPANAPKRIRDFFLSHVR